MSQQVGDKCTRCDGTGKVFDEVFGYGWSECPFFDVDMKVVCDGGRIVSFATYRQRTQENMKQEDQ